MFWLDKNNFYKNQSGFSLVEVIVTIGIIGMVTALVMVRYGAFNSSILLKNQAFEVALDLREAQVFAISVRGSGNEFREEYGLYFDMSTATQYKFFLDDPTNGNVLPALYDSSPSDEQIGDLRSLDSRFEIVDICINNASTCGVDALHVSFARPDFDAAIVYENGGSPQVANDARIDIAALTDPTFIRSVNITASGQITVE